MKIINIFIASSINEFDQARIYIGDFIRQMNEETGNQGFQVRLYLCEDEFQNSQSIYDRQIQQSDIFIALIGKSIGEFTDHEISDVAFNCSHIKEKVIVYTSNTTHFVLPEKIKSSFRIITIETDFIEQLICEIRTTIYKTLPYIQDSSTLIPFINNFYLSIPHLNNIECAVIGNIIRRMRDQGNGIIVTKHRNNDAYVALLSKDYDEEIDRIFNYINEGISPELLWIFASDALLGDKNKNTIDKIRNLTHNLNGKYFDSYQSYKSLSIVFQNKLQAALIKHNLLDGSAFIYIVQDHWLVRKGNNFGNNFINLLSTGYIPDSEEQSRKERVITNLLNYYWLNGKIDKHIKALEALQQSNYDFFSYSPEDLEEISLKHSEYKQAVQDYIFDNLEKIQLNIAKYNSSELLIVVNRLLQMLRDEGIALEPQKAVSMYILVFGILSFYNSLLEESYNVLKICWSYYQEIPNLVPKFVEVGKYCMLQLCRISTELSLEFECANWFTIAEALNNNDDTYKANILTFKRFFYRNKDINIENQCVEELCAIFQPKFVNYDNSNLSLYIQYRYLCIWNDFNNIPQYRNEIISLLNDYYTPYLSSDNHYIFVGMNLLSLCALSESNLQEAIELCDMTINYYKDIRGDIDRSIEYYNLLFSKAIILKHLGDTQKAIDLLKYIAGLYKGKRDKGCCYQNIALCYMDYYNNEEALSAADTYYNKSLYCFTDLHDSYRIGNVCDGIAYCYILQRRFSDAKIFAQRSLDAYEYKSPNKYANYISSLLCIGKYSEAVEFYNIQECKNEIRTQIQKDYNKEILDLNICVDCFEKFLKNNS